MLILNKHVMHFLVDISIFVVIFIHAWVKAF